MPGLVAKSKNKTGQRAGKKLKSSKHLLITGFSTTSTNEWQPSVSCSRSAIFYQPLATKTKNRTCRHPYSPASRKTTETTLADFVRPMGLRPSQTAYMLYADWRRPMERLSFLTLSSMYISVMTKLTSNMGPVMPRCSRTKSQYSIKLKTLSTNG